jgi:C4-dicarboxylate-binding protein DctP
MNDHYISDYKVRAGYSNYNTLNFFLQNNVHVHHGLLNNYQQPEIEYTEHKHLQPKVITAHFFDLPFLFDSPQTVDDFQQGPVGQELLHSMVDKGLLGLAYWHNGMKQLSANKPLRFPSDATGLKFRIQKSKVLDAQFKALGAIPVQLNFKETYTALKIGKVDGQENTWSNCVAEKYSEVQKYFSETNHGVLDYLLVTNVEFWNGLPSELRAELETIIREVTLEVNKRAMESALRDRQKIIYPGGAAVLTLTKEELAQWRNTMQPVWDEFKDEIGEEMIKEVATAVNNQP